MMIGICLGGRVMMYPSVAPRTRSRARAWRHEHCTAIGHPNASAPREVRVVVALHPQHEHETKPQRRSAY